MLTRSPWVASTARRQCSGFVKRRTKVTLPRSTFLVSCTAKVEVYQKTSSWLRSGIGKRLTKVTLTGNLALA